MAKKKLNKKEAAKKRNDTIFKNRIVSVFRAAEFQYLNIGNTTLNIGSKKGDIDLAFLYKNILVICEHTTTGDKHIKEHLNKTKIFYDEIVKDFNADNPVVLSKLKRKFSEKFEVFGGSFQTSRYQVKYLYFSQGDISIDTDFMDYIKIVNNETLEYFYKTNKILKYSSKNEIFKFLEVNIAKIGNVQSNSPFETIDTSVIAPEEVSGLKDMQIVSFLMKAEDLMECGYVLRKDNWEESAGLYQRLLIPTKIKGIREYLVSEKRGFVNNVIVSLPQDVRFEDAKGAEINTSSLDSITNARIQLPRKINSIGIIDGQHRIYAHYKSDTQDEPIISDLRKKLHILVTGLIFKRNISESEKRRIESKLFLEINHNTKKVSADVLFLIESIQNPNSNISIARSILLGLNNTDLFKNKFEMTTLNKSQIKSTSIIKFVLSSMVEISGDKETFFKYMSFDGKDLLCNEPSTSQEYENARENYIKECVRVLEIYFKAVKNNFKIQWGEPKTHKLFSVSSVNGFLIALRNTFESNGIKDFSFYDTSFKKLKVDFSKESFPYLSSKGWNDFAKKIKSQCFDK